MPGLQISPKKRLLNVIYSKQLKYHRLLKLLERAALTNAGLLKDGIVEIPDYYNGLPVCYIRANAFYRQECITEVIIGNNVTVIEGNVFMHCYNLEKVTLGNSLEVIDINVFLGCSQIKEIVIPSSVKSIGYNTFYDCYKLKSITLEDPNGWYTNDNIHKTYPVEDMSNAKTVAKYLTDTHVNHTWMKK